MEIQQTTIGGAKVYAIRSFCKWFFYSNYYGCLCIAEAQDDPKRLFFKLCAGNRHTLGHPSVCRHQVLNAVRRFIRKEYKEAQCPIRFFEEEDKDLDRVSFTLSCTF